MLIWYRTFRNFVLDIVSKVLIRSTNGTGSVVLGIISKASYIEISISNVCGGVRYRIESFDTCVC